MRDGIVDFTTVARAQMRLIARTPHRELIVLGIVGLILAVIHVNINVTFNSTMIPMTGFFGLYAVGFFGAMLWGINIWHDEGPHRRGYHWALPFDRMRHDLARVLAGALWLLAGLHVLVVCWIIMWTLGGAPSPFAASGFWLWLGFILGPFIVYFFCSAMSVASDHPGRWVVVTWVVASIVWVGAAGYRLTSGADSLDALLTGPLSPVRALGQPIIWAANATLEDAWSSSMMATWLPAVLVWLVLGIGAVLLAAKLVQRSA